MAMLNDIDEVVLAKANDLLTYIHLNADRHTLKKTRILCLAEIPELLIQFFEIIMDEPIPEELKPFRTIQDRSETLQSIIDTLEQYLKLPLSHISGTDLAKLDRRQLSDVIQIFDGLIKQIIEPKTEFLERQNLPQKGFDAILTSEKAVLHPNRPLSMEQLHDSPRINDPKERSDPNVRNESKGRNDSNVRNDPKGRNDPNVINTKPGTLSGRPSKISSSVSTNRAAPAIDTLIFRHTESVTSNESLPRKPLMTSERRSPSVTRTESSRIASSILSGGPVRRKPSVTEMSSSITTSSVSLREPVKRKPSVIKINSRTASPVSSRESVRSLPAKPLPVPLRRLSTKSVASPLKKSVPRRPIITRRPSTKSFKTRPTVVRLCSRSSYPSDTAVKDRVCVEQRKPSITAKSAADGRPSRSQYAKPALTPKRRKPSVVSSKLRKHSFGSPAHGDLKHGAFSARTVSLASSLTLLQEFNYVRKRLVEIEVEKEKHLDALRRLQDEKIGLVYVMEHIKKYSNKPLH